MATATKKPSPSSSSASASRSDVQDAESRSLPGRFLRLCDAIYRFLASLKLAVFSLGTLAAVLAYATFFESWYGAAAVQEWVYRTKGFALLLAFLGTNILCAALIRYPWKKRQIGFLITHAGLLTLLAGSWKSVQTADEGQLGMLEGETQSQLVRIDYPLVRVRKLDAHTQEPVKPEYAIDFRPGNFAWGPGRPRPRGCSRVWSNVVTLGLFDTGYGAVDVLATTPDDPFRLVVKSYMPASMPRAGAHPRSQGGADGQDPPPLQGAADAPGAGRPERGPELVRARSAVLSQRQDRRPCAVRLPVRRPPRAGRGLLAPPQGRRQGRGRADPLSRPGGGNADLRVAARRAGRQAGRLPDSDLTITFEDVVSFPLAGTGLGGGLGESSIPLAQFRVRQGNGAEVLHYGWGSLPMFPNVIPNQTGTDGKPQQALVAINYFLPPAIDPKANGLFGVVEVLGTPDGSLYYRVFGRGEQGLGVVRAVGPLQKGKEITAFGGNPNQPMTISFAVEEYLPTGREKECASRSCWPRARWATASRPRWPR